MAFPPTIGQLLNTPAALDFAAFFSPSSWAYVVGEVFFIIIFTYFYTAVTFNPVDQADNLKKYGGFIPGVRPGRPTAEYLDRILSQAHLPRRALPRRGRGPADDPDQPDLGQLLLRRHLDPDRRRRRARHRQAARVAADDAQLRGLPEVARAVSAPPALDREPLLGRLRVDVACRVGGDRAEPVAPTVEALEPATLAARLPLALVEPTPEARAGLVGARSEVALVERGPLRLSSSSVCGGSTSAPEPPQAPPDGPSIRNTRPLPCATT